MGLDLRLLLPAAGAWTAVLVGLQTSPLATGVAGVLFGLVAAALAWCDVRREWAPRSEAVRRLRREWAPRSEAVRVAGLCCGAVALVLMATTMHAAARQAGTVRQLGEQRAVAQVQAVVTSDPRVVQTRHPGRDGPLVIVRLTVKEVVGRGQVSRPQSPILLFGDTHWLSVRWHQRVAASVRLAPAERGDDIEAVAESRSPPTVLSDPGPLARAIDGVRQDLRTATDPLPADPRGLVPALVIGDTSKMPAELVDDMRATGMTHLNAVSGSNVTVVLMAVVWACGWLRIPRRWRLPCCLVALGLFVMLCRPEPSVVRASAMGAVGLLGTSLSRPHAAPPALCAAVIGLLCVDPWLASSYGFALSALATLGLILFARSWGAWFARFLPGRLAPLGEAIAVPVAAQACCAPVVVLLQGSVSIVGVPANIVAAPLVAPATLAGVTTAVIAPVSTTLAVLPGFLAGLPAWSIAATAHTFARVPLRVLPWPDGAFGAVLLAMVVLILLGCAPWLAARAARHPVVAAAAAALLVAAWTPLPSSGWPPSGWTYVACDVGQGDGGVLRTGPHSGVVIDVGPAPEPIDRCLDDLQITTLDAVVLTHFHADHVAGLAGALTGRPTREVITTSVRDAGSAGAEEELSQAPLVEQLAGRLGVPVRTTQAGDVWDWPGVHARVLWPAREIHAGSIQNNASVILDVTAGGVRMLFLGDAEREAQAQVRRALQQSADRTPISVLKVAHHGSANQDADLMRLVRSPVAVISVGVDNDYGHPAARTLDLLRDSGSVVLRTDRDGAVAIIVRGGQPWIARAKH